MTLSKLLGMFFAILLTGRFALAAGLPALAQPGISADGKEIAFVSGGSIWAVAVAGGDAHLLVTQSMDVSRPLYSPDGKQLAFISNATGNGDIYMVSLESGVLKRLTFDDAADRLDAWSGDSRTIFFSTAGHNIGTGTSDIYRVSVEGGTPMPVVAESYQNVFYATPNPYGAGLVFCANGMGASQWWRHGHSHIDECELWATDSHKHFLQLTENGSKNLWPTYSPDGKTIYFMSDRDGQENIWSISASVPTTGPAVQAVGTTSAFVTPTQVTHFHDGRVLWPTLSHDGKTMVFERGFGIWKLDLSSGEAAQVPIHLRGVVAEAQPEAVTLTKNITEFAVSHDGKKLAFVVQGQVFASPANGGNAVRVTQTNAVESHVAWANDDRRLAYVSTRDGPRHIFLYDFGDKSERRLTDSAGNDSLPIFSPDDSAIAFDRDGEELRLVDLEGHSTTRPTTRSSTTGPTTRPLRWVRHTGITSAATRPYRDHLLAGGLSFDRAPFDSGGTPFIWSGAGDWIACITGGAKGFRNLNLIPGDGSARPRQVSFLANTESSSLAWTPDGSSLFFGSGQRTEEAQLARVDLVPQTAKFRDDQFSELFKERPARSFPNRTTPRPPQGGDDEGVSPGVPQIGKHATTAGSTSRSSTQPAHHTDVDFEGIDQRLSLLPVGVDVGEVTVSPDGKYLGFDGAEDGRSNVYVYPIDPLANHPTARQLTDTAGGKSHLQFAPDENGALRLYYLEGRQIHWTPVQVGSTPTDIAITVDFEHDFDREKMLAFDEAWRYLNENFHDPKFHGVDWKAVHDTFEPYIAGARTGAEERRLLGLMIGELNASHLGVYGDILDVKTATARLGVGFDAVEYEATGKLKIASVVPFGPAALSKITLGKYLVSVDGKSTSFPVNLDYLLDHKIGKAVTLGLSDRADGSSPTDVKVTAINTATERTLVYRAWVNQNRDYVSKISGGRLGYIHIADMSEQALARLSTDLDARNENYDGVVIDIRNNNGGFANGYALDVFTRKNYLSLQARGFPSMTGRAALGQRYLGLPTILVTNRETLSDGEDFTEGYRSLGLGSTVGEPTAGWIIFTSDAVLIDGTQFRIPAHTVLDAKGEPMEMHPRPVDFAVSRAVNEPEMGKDSQLDEAVAELDKKLGGRRE